jgi:hypothetical protein
LYLFTRSAGNLAAAFSSFQAGTNAVALAIKSWCGCLLQTAKNTILAKKPDTRAVK